MVFSRSDTFGYWNSTPIEPTSAVSPRDDVIAAERGDVAAGGGEPVDHDTVGFASRSRISES